MTFLQNLMYESRENCDCIITRRLRKPLKWCWRFIAYNDDQSVFPYHFYLIKILVTCQVSWPTIKKKWKTSFINHFPRLAAVAQNSLAIAVVSFIYVTCRERRRRRRRRPSGGVCHRRHPHHGPLMSKARLAAPSALLALPVFLLLLEPLPALPCTLT